MSFPPGNITREKVPPVQANAQIEKRTGPANSYFNHRQAEEKQVKTPVEQHSGPANSYFNHRKAEERKPLAPVEIRNKELCTEPSIWLG
ncbi:MAG: hypothetical protein NT051_02410 [Candidatus Micrarchaeota archaeon]|nr:hypothetical protein [Candidatus Micrarchaeota archaeon]